MFFKALSFAIAVSNTPALRNPAKVSSVSLNRAKKSFISSVAYRASAARSFWASCQRGSEELSGRLKYCTIASPATGRLGQSLVSPGTLVEAYKTELVSVYPINPVYAVFEVDELTSLWYRDQIRAGLIGDPRNPATPLHVTIKMKDEKAYTTDPADRSRNGVVDYVDPEIVRATGTRVVRATFENLPKKGTEGQLLPSLLSAGDSVRSACRRAQRPVLAVPEGSCSASSGGSTSRRRGRQGPAPRGRARGRVRRLVEVNRRASSTARRLDDPIR